MRGALLAGLTAHPGCGIPCLLYASSVKFRFLFQHLSLNNKLTEIVGVHGALPCLTPCWIGGGYRCFGGKNCHHLQTSPPWESKVSKVMGCGAVYILFFVTSVSEERIASIFRVANHKNYNWHFQKIQISYNGNYFRFGFNCAADTFQIPLHKEN
jgi:hypothetical protein